MIDEAQCARPCPLCRSWFFTPAFYPPLVRCGGCGLIFRNVQRILERVREGYESKYSEFAPEQWIQDRRSSLYRDFLTRYRPSPGRNRLLDVGCGTGQFLKLARAAGWNVMGLEIVETAAESARAVGLPVVIGTLASAALPESSFDVVTFWNVLEFVLDPVEEVSAAKQALVPGGTLVVRVSNLWFQSAIFRLSSVFRCWPGLARLLRKYYIFHQSSFNARTLRQTLEQAGLGTIQITNSLPTYGDPYQTLRGGGDGVLQAVKRLVSALARLIAVTSGGKLLLGPSLLATAVKENRPFSRCAQQLAQIGQNPAMGWPISPRPHRGRRQGEGAHR